MTIDELHIAIDVGLRGTNTFNHLSIQPEEKDWWLNRAQYDYIWGKTDITQSADKQSFASSKKRLGDIQNLITSTTVDLYRESEGVYNGFLPSDFMIYIDDNSTSLTGCKNLKKETETIIKNYFVIPFKKITDYNIAISLVKNDNSIQSIFDSLEFQDLADNLYEDAQAFYYVYLIAEMKRRFNDINIYWENFNGNYYNQSFIIVTDSTYIRAIKKHGITIHNIPATSIGFLKDKASIDSSEIKLKSVLISPENFSKVSNDWFYKPKNNQILITIKNNKFFVYCSKNISINKISFDYYRIPQNINSLINITSEIDPTRHDELLDITLQKIRMLNPVNTVQN